MNTYSFVVIYSQIVGNWDKMKRIQCLDVEHKLENNHRALVHFCAEKNISPQMYYNRNKIGPYWPKRYKVVSDNLR